MKAAVFRHQGCIEVVDMDVPILKDNQVLLKIGYAGICGTDRAIFNGDIPCKSIVLGHEFSGEAIEMGSKVTNIKKGHYYNVQPNLSCGICDICKKHKYSLCENKISYGIHIDGGFAEYCVIDHQLLFPVLNISHIESALVEPIACCLHGLDQCMSLMDRNILIIGGGFIGLIFVQLAKLRGANVHLIEPNEKKRALAESFDADFVYESLSEIDTNFDLIIEAVGKSETVDDALKVVGRWGEILIFGVSSETESVLIKPYEMWEKELRIFGSRGNGHDHTDAIQLIPQLNVKDLVSSVIELDEINKEFIALGQDDYIKAIVHISGTE